MSVNLWKDAKNQVKFKMETMVIMMTYVVIKVSQFVHLNLQHSHWYKFLFALLDIIRAILALSTSMIFSG